MYIVAIVVLVLGLGFMTYLYSQSRQNNRLLIESYEKKLEIVDAAWTKGQEEIIESFDATYLTWDEQTAQYDIQVKKLQDEASIKDALIESLRKEREDLLATNLHLQVIANGHKEKCLPNLDLLRG